VIPVDSNHQWRMEDLLDEDGARGAAHAAARYHDNNSARQALTDLDRALRHIAQQHHRDTADDGPRAA